MFALNLNKKVEKEKKEIEHKNKMAQLDSIQKIRRIQDPNFVKTNYILQIHIHYAEEIEPSSVYSEVHWRNYRVVFWVNPSDQYETGASRGYPKFIWEQLFNIPLINVVTSEPKFLSLEVMRIGGNPGPSRGYIVVGRAKVALPKVPGIKECQRVGLVRFVDGQTVGEGHIIISLTLIQVNFHWRDSLFH
ncbi:hypothetical protein ES288_A08G255400v1 [Gossypium darwinii]|uniref:C2 domain-containing protein n=1 Tax=Gossypium darwinii TaxID=34276 RepID=A0A5D2FSY6_GOSDA|nr:hypothetical protein ES288_A08G255400v1 [Gossypium darwinii]